MDAGHAEDETEDDGEVPEDRRERRHREVLVAVQDPDDDPGQGEQGDGREEDARERDRQREVDRVEGTEDPRRDEHEERGQPGQDEQGQPEDARRDAPRTLAVAALEQLAEDGDERRRERGVGEQRPDEVRDLERDRECVDPARDAEVVARDALPEEAEDAREAGGEREDRRRPGEPAAGALVHGQRV